MHAFLGQNGAGKSTTMRVILGLDAPDAGQALVGGQRYQALRRPMTLIGSLLDAPALQPGRTGRNHLLWLARSQGLPASRADAVLAQVGLEKAARRKAGGYSLGMRQRLGIAAVIGAFAGLIVALVVGTMFITAEYRRGLIRTTLAATPRRGQVLAAKAIVTAAVAFTAGLAGSAAAVLLGERMLRGSGYYIFPVGGLTQARVIAGNAALLAVAAVLALALGAPRAGPGGPARAARACAPRAVR